jgi:acetolactate synthase-1/2/3 large subunit/5-guanidino-2-oxopentanoate decarboxylase
MAEQSPTRPLGAQISHMLKARGVDTIFGIPGVHNQEMYRGIEEAGITHVLARHEQGAGFMADGYARASGKPGVAYVITGPGLCNIMTPMGQAYSDSVPVLVISSCLDEVVARKGQLHQMKDQEAAAACVCDWSHEAKTPVAAYQLIDRALAEFSSQRPRPKHVQVPIKALEAAAPAAPAPQDLPLSLLDCPPMRATVAEAINQAKRPLFIFGGGAKPLAMDREAIEIVGKTSAACFTTYAGRGVIPDDYALNFGATLARPDSADIVASADLVIAVGTELAEVDLWRDHLGATAKMIRIDLDAAQLADAQRAEIKVLANAEAFLFSLLPEIKDRQGYSGWKKAEVAAARARWRAETDAERPGIVPICDALHAGLPEDVMVYSDMTQFAYVAKEVWPMRRPGHWHHPYGFGTLGYALPASIGGAMARRGKPTLCIAGDYGFQYTLPELGTAVELGLPLPILLWDNTKLKEIEDSMIRAQIAPNAVVAQNPDFGALARAYGACSERPGTLDELVAAVNAGFAADRPTLIHVTPDIL